MRSAPYDNPARVMTFGGTADGASATGYGIRNASIVRTAVGAYSIYMPGVRYTKSFSGGLVGANGTLQGVLDQPNGTVRLWTYNSAWALFDVPFVFWIEAVML